MHGPLPARLIGRSANGDFTDPDDLELALVKGANFIRRFKALESNVQHWFRPFTY
jgi:hypothetical protein